MLGKQPKTTPLNIYHINVVCSALNKAEILLTGDKKLLVNAFKRSSIWSYRTHSADQNHQIDLQSPMCRNERDLASLKKDYGSDRAAIILVEAAEAERAREEDLAEIRRIRSRSF